MHNWRRVTKSDPCMICGKPDWCMAADDAFFCMRVPNDHPHTMRDGSTGYVHHIAGAQPVTVRYEPKPEPVINCTAMMEEWFRDTPTKWIMNMARMLGVAPNSLIRLGWVYAQGYKAWAIPMRDGYGNIIGIRLRNTNGRKWAVQGSHQGIFLPEGDITRTTIICEGPTDTAAALTLGYYAIGRPSCSGGVADIIAAVRRLGISRVAICADNDDPGLNGAKMLSSQLPVPNVIILTGAKDLREYLSFGGNQLLLDSIIQHEVWHIPHQTDISKIILEAIKPQNVKRKEQ